MHCALTVAMAVTELPDTSEACSYVFGNLEKTLSTSGLFFIKEILEDQKTAVISSLSYAASVPVLFIVTKSITA